MYYGGRLGEATHQDWLDWHSGICSVTGATYTNTLARFGEPYHLVTPSKYHFHEVPLPFVRKKNSFCLYM
jgi:hypothetical protein